MCAYAIAASLALCGLSGCAQTQNTTDSSGDGGSEEAPAAATGEVSAEEVPNDRWISVEELSEKLAGDNPPQVIDVRSKGHFILSFIEGARNIPAGKQFEIRMDEVSKGREVALISADEEDVAQCRRLLCDAGYEEQRIFVVTGGMNAWVEAGYPTTMKVSRKC